MNANKNIDVVVDEKTVADLLTHNWWLLALQGLSGVLFGLAALFWPAITLLTLVLLFGGYALANGILSFIIASRAPKGYPRFGSLIFGGLVSIAAALITFFVPGLTALTFIVLIAAWAIFTGFLEILAAVRLRKVIPHEWLLIVAGIASVIFGALLLVQPGVGALVLIWWIGSFAIFFGILLTALAFRMRHVGHIVEHMA